MSYQYSAILTTVWVTFMYGTILPILYPLAAFTFFNYYAVDKFLITYYYQRPPVYDDKLNMRALELMKWAPVICMFFGYWFMGNMQIFNSKVVALQNTAEVIITEHTVLPSMNQALPLLIFGVIFLLGIIFSRLTTAILTKCKLYQPQAPWNVEHESGSYFQSLSITARKRWLAQELHS